MPNGEGIEDVTGCADFRHDALVNPHVALVDRLPTDVEHRALAEAVGWHHAFEWSTMAASLRGSTLGVVALDGDRVVGMGRVVGDGVKYFHVQDVVVIPELQGTGLGGRLVDRLLELIAELAPAPAFVALFSTTEGSGLYTSRGFSEGDMTGLFRILDPKDPRGAAEKT